MSHLPAARAAPATGPGRQEASWHFPLINAKENKPRRQLPLSSWLRLTRCHFTHRFISPDFPCIPPPSSIHAAAALPCCKRGRTKTLQERRRSPPPARACPGDREKPFASCCWAGLAPPGHPSPSPVPRGWTHPSAPTGFGASSTPRQSPAGPHPHLRSPVAVPLTWMEESKASPSPVLLNGRLSFLSGSATLQRPQSHSKSQFPAGTWRWAHSGGLHQAAGISSGGSLAETKVLLGPSQLGQGVWVQGWRQSLGWGQGLQETCQASPQRTALCHSSAQFASLCSGCWSWGHRRWQERLTRISPWGGMK